MTIMEKEIVYRYKCSRCGYIDLTKIDMGDRVCPACQGQGSYAYHHGSPCTDC